MKFRNKFIAKRIGTKTLASLLAFGMVLGSPMAAFADDGETAVVAENTVQAKKTDGSEAFVSVSDYVRGMMESGAVRLNNETGYLEDTSTGQKVDPETGERLTETPDVPADPAIPATPWKSRKSRVTWNPGESRKPRGSGKTRHSGNSRDTGKTGHSGKIQGHRKNRTLRKIQGHRKNRGTPEKSRDTGKNQKLQESRILRELQRHRKNQALRKNPDSPDSGKSDSKDPIQTPDTDKADFFRRPERYKDRPIPGSEIDHTQEISKAEEAAGQNGSKTAVSNSELINRQQIVKQPEMVEDFRFWTVARKYALPEQRSMYGRKFRKLQMDRADTSEGSQRSRA